jgi:PAS domain S-box-containing protein
MRPAEAPAPVPEDGLSRSPEAGAEAQSSPQADYKDVARMMTLFARCETRTRSVIECARDAIVLLDVDGRIESLNAAAEGMFGWSRAEAAGRSFLEELVAPRSRAAVAESITGGDHHGRPPPYDRWSTFGLRRGGEEFPIECHVTGLGSRTPGSCAFVRDLTEAHRLELELRQAQKLEAVGRLAAGIAHELNTPIQFIGDNTRFLQDVFGALDRFARSALDAARPEARDALARLAEELDLAYVREQAPRTLERTLQGVQRVSTIVRAMKEFAHPDQKEMTAADLNRAVQATVDIARNEYKYVADVETDLGPLPPVTCHLSELNQVVLNLIVNAAHAIGDVVKGTARRGKIRISTRHEGERVAISVSDTGAGIPEPIRAKVFDPFFTTKPVGQGTGQGLAIARSVVQHHRGEIAFTTAVGEGTTFTIRLPVEQRRAPQA